MVLLFDFVASFVVVSGADVVVGCPWQTAKYKRNCKGRKVLVLEFYYFKLFLKKEGLLGQIMLWKYKEIDSIDGAISVNILS